MGTWYLLVIKIINANFLSSKPNTLLLRVLCLLASPLLFVHCLDLIGDLSNACLDYMMPVDRISPVEIFIACNAIVLAILLFSRLADNPCRNTVLPYNLQHLEQFLKPVEAVGNLITLDHVESNQYNPSPSLDNRDSSLEANTFSCNSYMRRHVPADGHFVATSHDHRQQAPRNSRRFNNPNPSPSSLEANSSFCRCPSWESLHMMRSANTWPAEYAEDDDDGGQSNIINRASAEHAIILSDEEVNAKFSAFIKHKIATMHKEI